MTAHKASDYSKQWHNLRTHCYHGKKGIEEIMAEYAQLESAIATTEPTDQNEAFEQLQVALILWREDISTREEAPEFLKQRYLSMDAMFRRVLGFLK